MSEMYVVGLGIAGSRIALESLKGLFAWLTTKGPGWADACAIALESLKGSSEALPKLRFSLPKK